MKKITVKPDQSKNYESAFDALEDLGYERIGKISYKRYSEEIERTAFKKDNDIFVYLGMDHYNTTIYSVELGKASTLKEYQLI